MPCTKTGCHVFIAQYDEYGYGDAYEVGGVAVFRICQRSREPLSQQLHYTIYDFDQWFDKDQTSMTHNSTMVSNFYENHGYEGKPV